MRNVRTSDSLGSWPGLALVCALTLVVSSVAQGGVGAPTVVPPHPTLTSFMAPAEYFRRLLNSAGAERERMLSSRPEQREQYQAFIDAYEKLPPEERERRLQALELRLLITFVLRLQPESRTQVVSRLPADLRPLVQSRVDYWNQFSPDVQRFMLENARLMRLVSQVSPGLPLPPPPGGRALDSQQLQRIEGAIRQWNSLPESRRAAAEAEFQRILATQAPGPIRVTLPLPPEERAKMEQALARFKELSHVQRSNCVRNFGKLAELSSAEREEFLRSAGEWRKMSPGDRESWRELIRRAPLPPPPPGLKSSPLPFVNKPILPRLMATNGTNGTYRNGN